MPPQQPRFSPDGHFGSLFPNQVQRSRLTERLAGGPPLLLQLIVPALLLGVAVLIGTYPIARIFIGLGTHLEVEAWTLAKHLGGCTFLLVLSANLAMLARSRLFFLWSTLRVLPPT